MFFVSALQFRPPIPFRLFPQDFRDRSAQERLQLFPPGTRASRQHAQDGIAGKNIAYEPVAVDEPHQHIIGDVLNRILIEGPEAMFSLQLLRKVLFHFFF